MNRMCKLVAALLAGVLSAAALASCNGGNAETTTTVTTEPAPVEQEPVRTLLSPGELFKLLMNTADFTVESKLLQNYPNYDYVHHYSMEKDDSRIKTRVYEKDGALDAVEEINYADLEQSTYYALYPKDWVFASLKDTFFADGLETFLYDVSPMADKRPWNDRNYEAYDPETRSYRMKRSVLKQVFSENDWEAPPKEYSLTYYQQNEKYVFVYSWKSDSVTSEMRTEITLQENSINLPKAENDPVPETPYQGEKMQTILNNFIRLDYSNQPVHLYSIGFSEFGEDESIERMIDGIKPEEQWYYNEDGSLKENAFPELGKGGGPGKCAGVIADYTDFVFCFETPQTVAAYVLTNANDNKEFGNRTPVRWTIFATNDERAGNASTAMDAQWFIIDYVWDGGMSNENFAEGCYLIDKENRGYYQYYCLEIVRTDGNQFQLGELEFYIGY